jgi:hypothetical protein
MNDAVQELEKKFDCEIPEFTVAAVRINGEYNHCWYLGTDKNLDDKKVAIYLDEALKSANKNYKVARSKALKNVKVKSIPMGIFYEWNAENKKKGDQVKMEKVMSEKKFLKWEAFVKRQLKTG